MNGMDSPVNHGDRTSSSVDVQRPEHRRGDARGAFGRGGSGSTLGGGELPPYPAYKDSGVEWLGAVPAHWEVRRLKNWLGVNELLLSEDTDPEYTFDYLDIGSVETGRLAARPQRIRFGNSPSRARRVVRSGDTIVSTVRTYLKAVWHAEHPGADLIASTGFAVLTPRRGTSPSFASYLCQSDPFTNRVTAESVGIAYPAIAETRLGTFEVCVPPVAEQVAIARFLDAADRRIQRYIRAKEKLIGAASQGQRESSLVHEWRTRLIADVVTGKLDVRKAAVERPDKTKAAAAATDEQQAERGGADQQCG